MAEPVTLLELLLDACRWPVTDNPNMLFCGERADEGCPYCKRHRSLAYVSQRSGA